MTGRGRRDDDEEQEANLAPRHVRFKLSPRSGGGHRRSVFGVFDLDCKLVGITARLGAE